MAFNEAQKRAIRHTDGPALVLAGPGSGKTTVITNRVRYLTEKVRRGAWKYPGDHFYQGGSP